MGHCQKQKRHPRSHPNRSWKGTIVGAIKETAFQKKWL
jgi:hypothetical protein